MNNPRQRRHFGMTLTQLIVLGCLALAAIGTIFGGFIFISSSTTPGGASIFPTESANSPSDVTIVPPDQAGAPGSPFTIPSVASSDQIPNDWKTYNAATIELSVPPQFESVDAETERQRRIQSYRNQGLTLLADRLENASSDYWLWFNFPQPETVIYDTHIVVKADILPTLTLDEYVDQTYVDELQGFQVVDRENVTMENLEAQRILLEANLNDQILAVADYVITDEVNLWVISASSSREEFYSWLPTFDQVARSFRLLY